MEDKSKSNIIKSIIGLAAITFGMIFCFSGETEAASPVDTIKIIREALQKKDVATFQEYVNLDSIANKAADEFIAIKLADYYDKEGGNISRQEFKKAFEYAQKEEKAKDAAEIKTLLLAGVRGESLKNIRETWEIRSISKPDIVSGDYAIVWLRMYDNIKHKAFNVILGLRCATQEFWYVEDVENSREVFFGEEYTGLGVKGKDLLVAIFPNRPVMYVAPKGQEQEKKTNTQRKSAADSAISRMIIVFPLMIAVAIVCLLVTKIKGRRKGNIDNGKKVQKIYGIASTMPPHQQQSAPTVSPQQQSNTNLNDLWELKKLLDEGVITQEEFEVAKRKILN